MLLPVFTILSLYICKAFASCNGSKWQIDYDAKECTLSNGEYQIKCQSPKFTSNCGMRLSSRARLGKGTYSAMIKAAPGDGINTAFYLFSYGRDNDKSYAWNEIDIEILGKQIQTNGNTSIWTNVWTGYCMY